MKVHRELPGDANDWGAQAATEVCKQSLANFWKGHIWHESEAYSVEDLRAAGWGERGIYEATALISFFNFSGRMEAASGLPMDRIPEGAKFPEATPGKPTVSARA